MGTLKIICYFIGAVLGICLAYWLALREAEARRKKLDQLTAARESIRLEEALKPTEIFCANGAHVSMQLVLEPERHYELRCNGQLLHQCKSINLGNGHWRLEYSHGGGHMGSCPSWLKTITFREFGETFLLIALENDRPLIRIGEQIVRPSNELVEVVELFDRLFYVCAVPFDADDIARQISNIRFTRNEYIYEVYEFGNPNALCTCEDVPVIITSLKEPRATIVSHQFQEVSLMPLLTPTEDPDELLEDDTCFEQLGELA